MFTLSFSPSNFNILFRATYRRIGERAEQSTKPISKVLDIGTATGHPLKSIIDKFQNAQVLGVDIDNNYVPACQKLFKDNINVSIEHMNFYDLEKNHPSEKFDVIIFGSSFMLMPDQIKAIEIAKSIFIIYSGTLNTGGKIYFLLTLFNEKTTFT